MFIKPTSFGLNYTARVSVCDIKVRMELLEMKGEGKEESESVEQGFDGDYVATKTSQE